MLSILCPHCRTTLTVEERWRGKAINCISCGNKLAVPAAKSSNATAPEPSVAIATGSARGRRRKTGFGTRLISMTMHLTITAATIYGGYYLITQRRANAPLPEKPAEAPPEEKPVAEKPKAHQQAPEPVEDANEAIELAEAPEATVEVAPPVSPFEHLPASLNLPVAAESTILTLVESLPEAEIELVSNDLALTHRDRKVQWSSADSDSSVTVAGLTVIDGSLKFRWMSAVPLAAETALHNSIVRLHCDEFQHTFALRSAQAADPITLDLGKTKQKVICKCDFAPELEGIRFELAGIAQLPATQVEGVDPATMQLGDQTTLRYSRAPGAATRLTMKKQGNVAIVEIESRFVLPSGEEQPMSIKRGNLKIKELDALLQEATAAEQAIVGLRSRRQNLQSQMQSVAQSRATATAKAIRMSNLQEDLAATRQKLSYAERLATQKSAIGADQRAIHEIAEIAQQLHTTELTYRFFTVVDGHEIDLVFGK